MEKMQIYDETAPALPYTTYMREKVLIYQDYIHNNGALYHALAAHFGARHVGFCDAAAVIAGALDPGVALFVMPGGADLYYCEKLNGAGNRAIRNFVESGGSYLGLCAGAYYACAGISWAAGTDESIEGPRELKFYSGMATGPIPQFMKTLEKPWLRAVTITDENGPATVCYEAGPVFAEPTGENEKVFARFTDIPGQPPSIVESRIGQGLAILSSPHIERLMPASWSMLYTHDNPHYDPLHKTYKTLAKDSARQVALWDAVLARLAPDAKKDSARKEPPHVAMIS